MSLRDDIGGSDYIDVTRYHCGWSYLNHKNPIIFDGVAVFSEFVLSHIKFKLGIFGCKINERRSYNPLVKLSMEGKTKLVLVSREGLVCGKGNGDNGKF